MQRNRQNTEHELHIISVAHNTRLRVGTPTFTKRCQDWLYALVYNRFYWNAFTFSLFLTVRLVSLSINITEVSIEEWYNDTLLFLFTNNYMFKRLHWNNKNDDFYRTSIRHFILPFYMITLLCFSLISHNMPTFYITKESVVNFDSYNKMVLGFVVLYAFLNQLLSFNDMCKSRRRNKLLKIQLVKYILLSCYLLLDRILLAMHVDIGTHTIVENKFHIHHWFCGLIMIFLTEMRQPYYSILQYIHYAVYLHGVALYSYDSILQ